MGWLHLKVLSRLGLARIRRVAAQPELVSEKQSVSIDSLRAIFVNRMHVLSHYTNNVTLPVLKRELEHVGENANAVIAATRRLLAWQPEMLDEMSRSRLAELIERHPQLKTVLQYRNELKSLWDGANRSNEKLLSDFRQWCARAEASGIQGLADFVAYLKSYRAMPEPAAS